MKREQDVADLLPELDFTDVLRQRPLGLGSVRHVLRVSIAVTVSYVVALWLSKSTLGIFAPITTLIVVQSSPWSTLGVSIQRILGTGIGVLVASLWINLVGLTWWSFALGVLASLLVARLLPWSIGGQMQIPVAVIFVLALGPGTLDSDLWRVVDVVIGGVIGLLAVFVFPPRPHPEKFELALQDYRQGIVDTVQAVADEAGTHSAPLADDEIHAYVPQSRQLRERADKARDALVSLVEVSHWNVRAIGIQERFANDALRVRRLTGIGIQVRGIVGAANRLYDRPGPAPLLSVEDLRAITTSLIDLMAVVLGAPGTPVEGTDREQAVALDGRLRDLLRSTADRVVATEGADTLPAVSLIGRFDHIRLLLADFPGWEG